MSKQTQSIRALVLTAVFAALIIVMTVTPYLGYISYGGIEITTLHIVVILAGVCLGPWLGAVVGGVWGLSCIARAYIAFPVFLDYGFGNFFVACLPRILVGLVAGAVFALLRKTKLPQLAGAAAAAVAGTLTNTVCVLTAMHIWQNYHHVGEMSGVRVIFGSIFQTLVGVNGVIELVAAIILVPALYRAVSKVMQRAR
ncbi:MAG: ECF transporter S component [Clostridia bacterium]|nr:ECF transporter S component [Clostridia bacterium]